MRNLGLRGPKPPSWWYMRRLTTIIPGGHYRWGEHLGYSAIRLQMLHPHHELAGACLPPTWNPKLCRIMVWNCFIGLWLYLVVSQNLGTPKMVALILGNRHLLDRRPWLL